MERTGLDVPGTAQLGGARPAVFRSPINTDRVTFRQWTDADREPFAAMGADPEVMRYFPALLTRSESDASLDRFAAKIASDGWGLWALEVEGRFVGFTGLATPRFVAPFMDGMASPCVEIGWRLTRDAWGKGLATESARAVLDFGFRSLELAEIVSFTSVTNTRSQAVMLRLGMTHNPLDDFEHPSVPVGSPLRPHVLYRRHAAEGSAMGSAEEAGIPHR